MPSAERVAWEDNTKDALHSIPKNTPLHPLTSWTVQPFTFHASHPQGHRFIHKNNIQDVEQSPAYHGSAHCECYIDVLDQNQSVIKCWRQSTESQDSSDPSTHRTVSTSKEQSQPADSHEVTSVFVKDKRGAGAKRSITLLDHSVKAPNIRKRLSPPLTIDLPMDARGSSQDSTWG